MRFLAGCLLSLVASCALAQSNNSLSGQWLVTSDLLGTPMQQVLTLQADRGKLSGHFGQDDHHKIAGTIEGNSVHFSVIEDKDTTGEYQGALSGDKMSGTARIFDAKPEGRIPITWTAVRVPPVPTGPPEHHEFVPTKFQRAFSPFVEPVLHIKSGDTVHTTTVDAGGRDEKGVRRVLGGNPETGPFYIDGALPGDALKVTLVRLRLNRDWASSDDALVSRPGASKPGPRSPFSPCSP